MIDEVPRGPSRVARRVANGWLVPLRDLRHCVRRRQERQLGVFAEFETNLRRERQMEGINAARLRGVYKGRPPSIDAAKVAALKAEGLGATEIAKRLKVGRASVYRLLAS